MLLLLRWCIDHMPSINLWLALVGWRCLCFCVVSCLDELGLDFVGLKASLSPMAGAACVDDWWVQHRPHGGAAVGSSSDWNTAKTWPEHHTPPPSAAYDLHDTGAVLVSWDTHAGTAVWLIGSRLCADHIFTDRENRLMLCWVHSTQRTSRRAKLPSRILRFTIASRGKTYPFRSRRQFTGIQNDVTHCISYRILSISTSELYWFERQIGPMYVFFVG